MEFEIWGNYPIILDGEVQGELSITQEGLFWSFEAKCGMREEIVRLSVYGDGKEGYLGVMEPCGDMLLLKKKLSRGAMSEFPQHVSHGGRKGLAEKFSEEQTEAPRVSGETSQYSGEFPLSYYRGELSSQAPPPDDNKPPAAESLSPPHISDELAWSPCACPCSLFTGLEEKKVCSFISGAFAAIDGESLLLAVPEDIALALPDSKAIYFVDTVFFSESAYLVCKIEHGKSIPGL